MRFGIIGGGVRLGGAQKVCPFLQVLYINRMNIETPAKRLTTVEMKKMFKRVEVLSQP